MQTQTLANGARTTSTYNALGQVTDLSSRTSGGSLLAQFYSMRHDGAGNRADLLLHFTNNEQLDGETSYPYDTKNQLTQEQAVREIGGYTDGFAYDAAGNLTTFKGTTKSYNANNQQTAPSFAHDGNGNPTTYNGVSLSFDPENRLTAYGSVLTAGYTGDGLRAWKQTTSGGRIYYLYDGTLPLMEVGGGNANIIRPLNTYGAAGLVSRVVGAAPQVGGAQSEFYAFDPQGSVVARVDAGGHTTATEHYRAHGAAVSGGASVWGYGAQWGYQTDQETGLQLLTHRYYDPQVGRFLTRDPIDFAGGINLYSYVKNNPINYADPAGLQEVGSGFRPESYPPAPPYHPLYPDNFDWWGTFRDDLLTHSHRAKLPCKSWAGRWWDNVKVTNQALPGLTTLSFFGIGLGSLTGRAFANEVGGLTIGDWIASGYSGFRGYSSLEAGLTAAGVGLGNFALTTFAWEGGVAIGSTYMATFPDACECSH